MSTPTSHSVCMSCIKGSTNTSISNPGCVCTEIRMVSKRYFLLNQEGKLYIVRITGHVLCMLLVDTS